MGKRRESSSACGEGQDKQFCSLGRPGKANLFVGEAQGSVRGEAKGKQFCSLEGLGRAVLFVGKAL